MPSEGMPGIFFSFQWILDLSCRLTVNKETIHRLQCIIAGLPYQYKLGRVRPACAEVQSDQCLFYSPTAEVNNDLTSSMKSLQGIVTL